MNLINLNKKFIKSIPLFLSLIFILCINLHFRSFPINFPQLKTYAKNIIYENIRRSISIEIYKKFPHYDPLAKERLIEHNFNGYKRYFKKEIKKQIEDLYHKLKEKYQDQNGQTYLMELDCWHWARYVRNVIYLGHPGDTVIGGKQFDNFMLAPKGDYLPWYSFLFYFSAFLYKVFSLFINIPIFTFLFYLPLFFTSLLVISLFFFSFYHGRYICALISCTFLGLSAHFIPRSCAGWFDKDVLNILFPILSIWSYLKAKTENSFKKKIFWISISSLNIALFCFNWGYWWFVFYILIGYEILILLTNWLRYLYFKEKVSFLIKESFLSLIYFILSSLIGIFIFSGKQPFLLLIAQLRETIFLTKAVEPSIWPNVYATVGELKKPNIKEIVNSLGGLVIFGSSVISIVILLLRNLFFKKDEGFKSDSIIILTLWFISMLYASLQGVRFIVFLSFPLSVCLGWLLNDIYIYFKKLKNFWGIIVIFFLVGILSTTFIANANKIAKGIYPLMDKQWYKVLTLIRDTTPKDAIVNSWWDFGDWFKVVAERPVIFDGQTQNNPQAYWMARVFLSQDEELSLAILRMLNNGGNDAFELIDSYIKDPLRSVLILETILSLDRDKAKENLLKFLPLDLTEKVLSLIFNKPRDAYFVVDYSLVSKIGAISFLGNWNFAKVYMIKNFIKEEKERILDYLVSLGKNREEMLKFYQELSLISPKDVESWISRPFLFYTFSPVNGKEKEGLVFFDNGFVYNPKEKTIQTSQNQFPRSLFVLEENNFMEFAYPKPNFVFSILVYKENENYKAVVLDRELANSLFVKLYFFKGKGLKHFKLHIDACEGENFIGVYRIDW